MTAQAVGAQAGAAQLQPVLPRLPLERGGQAGKLVGGDRHAQRRDGGGQQRPADFAQQFLRVPQLGERVAGVGMTVLVVDQELDFSVAARACTA